MTNSGTIEATGAGGLQLVGSVVNNGLILAQGSSVTIGGDVSGSGHVELAGNATVEFAAGAANDLALDADAAGLIVFDHSAGFGGAISGLNADDRIDLRDVAFGAATTLSYVDDGSGGGVLTVSDGIHSAQLRLVGSYQASDFVLGADDQGGLLLTNHAGQLI